MSRDSIFLFYYDLFMKFFYRYIVEPTYIFKILIIGDREVGRRTFLRESRDRFFNVGRIDIIGVEAYKKELTVEEGTVIFMIWNVSNKEMFRRDLRAFISGSNAVILIFDLTNLNSLDYLSEFPQMIREQAGEIPILLVGNKIDLEEGREVSRDQGTTFARINDLLGYIEISAKTEKNCEGIFELLAEKILIQLEIH